MYMYTVCIIKVIVSNGFAVHIIQIPLSPKKPPTDKENSQKPREKKHREETQKRDPSFQGLLEIAINVANGQTYK